LLVRHLVDLVLGKHLILCLCLVLGAQLVLIGGQYRPAIVASTAMARNFRE